MHRYFLVVVGCWKFENWRLYRLREHRNHNGKVRWHMWDKCFQRSGEVAKATVTAAPLI